MQLITIEEFKDQSNIEIIESILKINNGYITSKIISEFGILKEKGMIEKVINEL